MQIYCHFDFTDIIYYLKGILDAFLDIFQENSYFFITFELGCNILYYGPELSYLTFHFLSWPAFPPLF